MSASTAIGMVSSSLRNLLLGEMQLNPAVNVTILAPDEVGGQRCLNLFLYKVEENTFLSNQDWMVKSADISRLAPPALSLGLSYLMTAYALNDPQTGNAAAHQILGEAMRVFYENGVIPVTHLETGLKNAREQLRIVHNTFDPEELSRIWSTFGQPYRLSVLYQVSTVQLDMLPQKERPLPKRVRVTGVPGVRAPFVPPVVFELTPASGAVGTSVLFTGQNLSGWRAHVAIGGQDVLPDLALTGDTFAAIIPAGLQPGFYDLVVDISGLFRRTFLFEVTP
jgi:hypothetical protein